MIGSIKGIIDHLYKDHIIIDVNGVGYIIYCSSKIIQNINIGDKINLIIETHVREDHINLYGFTSYNERDWFRALITAKGVGSRVALAILSVLSQEQLSIAISKKDKLAFTQIPGIGPKLADRIIMELKDKIIVGSIDSSSIITNVNDKNIVNDAVSALINLGYNKTDSYNISSKLFNENDELTLGELIRISLKELTRR